MIIQINEIANEEQIKLIKGGDQLTYSEIKQLLSEKIEILSLHINNNTQIKTYITAIENSIQEIIKNRKNNYRLIISFEHNCGTILNIEAKDVPDLLNIVNNSRRIEIFEHIALAKKVSKILKPFNEPVFYIKDDNHNTVATLVKDNPVDVFVQR
jgi:mRNA-degrading endonuclease RelE of RelBE toxin-antitoxin system